MGEADLRPRPTSAERDDAQRERDSHSAGSHIGVSSGGSSRTGSGLGNALPAGRCSSTTAAELALVCDVPQGVVEAVLSAAGGQTPLPLLAGLPLPAFWRQVLNVKKMGVRGDPAASV